MRLAIIIPVLNEGPIIASALARLQALRACGSEVIVIDGGSQDDTTMQAQPLVDRVMTAPRGRAAQMNAGAAAASAQAEALLFLHADADLPADADRLITDALDRSAWGRFDVRINGSACGLGMVAFLMNRRSRATGICTGDQGIFMRREFFDSLGGFADIALMEDIEFSRRARRIARPVAIAAPIITSGRRWDERGVARTIVLMWGLRLRYFFGADPQTLARHYDDGK
jgi:rSAM/selenodomain-associated transferase 2